MGNFKGIRAWKFNGYLTPEDCEIYFQRLGVCNAHASDLLGFYILATNRDYRVMCHRAGGLRRDEDLAAVMGNGGAA